MFAFRSLHDGTQTLTMHHGHLPARNGEVIK